MNETNKIGILTFHDTTNFGAVLQAVATYKAIKRFGYVAEIINYHNENIDKREIPEFFYKNKYISLKHWLKYILVDSKFIIKHKNLLEFLKTECKVSSKYYNKNNIVESNELYDVFFVGSDMLWCADYTKSDFAYMLDFAFDCKRKYAFATSIGNMWSDSDKNSISGLLRRFNSIALREKNSCDIVGQMIGCNIDWVCDPTMLIEPQEWLKYANIKYDCSDYALIYMDDNKGNCLKAAKAYSKENKIEIRQLGFKIRLDIRKRDYIYIEAYTIEEFLSAVKNAKILFTASYHGMLFAIYFHVPFVFYNKDSSRLLSVASRFGVEYRNGNAYEVSKMKTIDWNKVDSKREDFRGFSLGILKSMLGKKYEK